MREKFRGYYRPSAEELQSLWNTATIVFDANVLLDFHRYEATTSATYLELASAYQERLWLPFQAAHEYHENRLTVRSETNATHKEQINHIEKLVNAISQSPRKSHLTAGEKHQALLAAAKDLLDELREESTKLADRNGPSAEDEVLEKITALYEGKVGDEPSTDDLEKLYKEGASRFAQQIPPGYKDQPKEGNRKYGDFVFWRQVLDHAKEHELDIILVTEDAKEDWWVSAQGRQIMPRPELIKEFREYSGGRSIHIYNGLSFFNYAASHVQSDASHERIVSAREELEDVAQQRAENQNEPDPSYAEWPSRAAYDLRIDPRVRGPVPFDAVTRASQSLQALHSEIRALEAEVIRQRNHMIAREEAGTEPDDPMTSELRQRLAETRARLNVLYDRAGLSEIQQHIRQYELRPVFDRYEDD
ncbi:PIN domain-containing protein [Arthrobacter sp. NPDC057013]|uniref:PIN domain-containing protein n=1 Tax=Arthrobacter sp. NPDC057013 TaxID=3345999 RepID=UPI00362D4B4F